MSTAARRRLAVDTARAVGVAAGFGSPNAVVIQDGQLAAMLHRVHEALRSCRIVFPSFVEAIDHAREVLADDHRMASRPGDDLILLREAFDPIMRAHAEHHLGVVRRAVAW